VPSMLLKKRRKSQSTTAYAVEQIEEAIFNKGLRPGDKLPSSGELQKLLGTSQGALREALRILREKGLIEVKPGRSGGIYVRAVTSSRISDSLALMIRQKQISPEHLLIFRSTLEVSAASLAVIEAKEKNIKQLNVLMTQAKSHLEKGVVGWDGFYRVEDLMHQALVKMTKNPLFESVLLTVYRHYQGYNNELVPKELKNMKEAFQDWRELLEALETRRPQQAGRIMTRHLQRFLPTESTEDQMRKIKELFVSQED